MRCKKEIRIKGHNIPRYRKCKKDAVDGEYCKQHSKEVKNPSEAPSVQLRKKFNTYLYYEKLKRKDKENNK